MTAIQKLGKFIDSEVIADLLLDLASVKMPERWTLTGQGVALGKDAWLSLLEDPEFHDVLERNFDKILDRWLKPF